MKETNTIDISQKLFLLVSGFLAILAFFMMNEIMYQLKSLPQNAPHEVSVSGEGKIYAKPDIATISFGVHTQANKSQDAVNQNNKLMDQVVTSIKGSGVKDDDIQTTFYNLTPLYDYTEEGSVFRGYSLDQQVLVKIRDFDKINEVLDKATLNGANTVGNLQFTVDDMEKVRAEARQKAIVQAKEKAASLLSQSGLRAVRLVNIAEGFAPSPVPMYGFGGATVMDKESVAPSIQAGQVEVNSMVTLTYQVK